jgi:flavin prenyltransferase
MKKQRLVVGISGSSGAILGIRLLEALRQTPIETHLIVTTAARLTIEQETGWKTADVLALASAHYSHRDMAAAIASGSFDTLGMVVIPCSVKSLSAIANSYSADLLARAADVTLKEGRPLVLVFREAPLHAGHIQLMEQAARAGAILFPPVPAFYTHPQTVDEIVDNIVGRVLRRLGIENELYTQWQGLDTDSEVAAKTDPGNQPAQNIEGKEFWDLPAMTLATTGKDGMPYAATVYFACGEDRQLFFFSAGDSQHSANLAGNPQAAVTIHPLADSWQEIRGLQLQGQVHPVADKEEWEAAWRLYMAKFPFAADLKDVVAKNTLYAFQPDWIRLIDNRRGFGFKEEWTGKHDQ